MSKPSTDPGLGPPSSGSQPAAKKTDTVDDILDGFGSGRADQPRILPKKGSDITPTPPDISARKELTPTVPGARQKKSRYVVATIIAFGAVLVLGLVLVKLTGGGTEGTPTPTPATATPKETAVMTPRTVVPVPTDTATETATADTAVPSATVSAKPLATARPTATASAKPTATTTATGDAPGLHLIKGN